MPECALKIEPLTPTIGAEVHGVDLTAPLEEPTVRAIHDALMEHLTLFFRDQDLTVEQLAAFGRRFGAPHTHPTEPGLPGHPGIMRIHADADSKVYAGRMWHSDVSCDPEPPMGSVLHLHEVPEHGGDTLFANAYAAYEALSEPMRDFVAGLTAVHASAHNFQGYYGVEDKDTRDGFFPENIHPVVRRHPVTGRKVLFVNEIFTTRIVELEAGESRALLRFLFEHIAQPRFQCRFRWRRNSVAFWDNRAAQHMALWDYYPATRSGHRFTICGERPS